MGQTSSIPRHQPNNSTIGKHSHTHRRTSTRDSPNISSRDARARERSPVQYSSSVVDDARVHNEAEKRLRKQPTFSAAHELNTARLRHGKHKSNITSIPHQHRTKKIGADPPNVKLQRRPKGLVTSSPKHSHITTCKEPQVARETKECSICVETCTIRHFPDRKPTSHCQHENDVCKRCLRTWISSEFATKIWDNMTCPSCLSSLTFEDMQAFAPKDVFRRYSRLATRAAMESIQGFTWCRARNCTSGHIHAASTNRFTCIACKKTHCIVHNVAWHQGETCNEYEYRTNKSVKKTEEIASRKLIGETAKMCPKCKRWIEKKGGCNHMTCLKCKHQFCWVCSAPYNKRRVVHVAPCMTSTRGMILDL